MVLGNPINIRLPIEQQLKYEFQAAEHNLPLRTYLRQKLEASDHIIEEISALKRAMQEIASSLETSSSESTNPSIMLEMLLLLRQLAQPQKVHLAQQELKRLGFDIWEGGVDKDNDF